MTHPTREGDIFFFSKGRLSHFTGPTKILAACRPEDIRTCMDEVAKAVDAGMFAAGFITYEAAPGFDTTLITHPPGELPLAYFALYVEPPAQTEALAMQDSFSVGAWVPGIGEQEYRQSIARIRDLIAAGDTYQVNYTFPMTAPFSGDALGWFHSLCAVQRSDYAAFVDLGRFKVLSASPELFFRLEGTHLETRPMKGTRPRGRWPEEDHLLAKELLSSEKDRAENLMIVDLLRNDMGRVSETRSVRVPRLFELERYETVWQMTSTITSKTEASVPEIFAALFPSGSVTGAPKVRTMQIIRDLEPFPRGVYCGAIGWWAPGRRAEFNVAIRTAVVDTHQGTARYNVGGGITWDSTAGAEYEECRVKAAILTRNRPDFELLETLLYDNGYFLLERHLKRLKESGEYFGFDLDIDSVRAELTRAASAFGPIPERVRLLANREGRLRIEHTPLAPLGSVCLGLAVKPVDERDVFLYHKTTHRSIYEDAKASRPDCSDVLLWNDRGEITETSIANIALLIDGEWLTPPLSSGLLAGVMRAELLETGRLGEAILLKADLARATSVAIFNSVRKWVEVHVLKAEAESRIV